MNSICRSMRLTIKTRVGRRRTESESRAPKTRNTEDDTAESRGGRRARERGFSLYPVSRASGLPLWGRSPLGSVVRSSQGLNWRSPEGHCRALRRGVAPFLFPACLSNLPGNWSCSEACCIFPASWTRSEFFSMTSRGPELVPDACRRSIMIRQKQGSRPRGEPRGELVSPGVPERLSRLTLVLRTIGSLVSFRDKLIFLLQAISAHFQRQSLKNRLHGALRRVWDRNLQ